MTEERFCTNCRAPLPSAAAWCEECGAHAGEVFDGRVRQRDKPRTSWASLIVVMVVVAAGLWFGKPLWTRYVGNRGIISTSEPRVVKQRPGGARRAPGAVLSEPEAMIALRKSTGLKDECVAVISRGFDTKAYAFDAVDRCRNQKLGRFRVDAKSGEVRKE